MVKKKVLIFIISYKASYRIKDVFNKIPFQKLKNYNLEILLSDDASKDDTMKYAKLIKANNKTKKITIKTNNKNIGYGAHIKKCLRYSLKKNFQYAVMIHGDGQFDPKYIPELLKYISNFENVSACTGSRILKGKKNASKGGMPLYKLIGNIVLTKIFNFFMNKNYTDAHTGLWAYNLKFLKNLKFNILTDGFNFDQELRFRNILDKKTIKEITIKTRYVNERSQLHIKYAFNFFIRNLLFFLIKKKIIKSKKFILR